MKKLFNWAKQTAINFFKWVWRECRNWQTIALLLLVCIIVGAPVWICGLLGLLFNWTWAWAVFAALLAFWWLPGMPYFAVCVAITLGIKRFFQKYKRKHPEAFQKGNHNDDAAEENKEEVAETVDVGETQEDASETSDADNDANE